MKTRCATVSFKTVGCRLNQAETAMIRASFEEAGFATVPFGELCDICIIHGCVVTSKAEEDSARLVRSIKRRHPDAFVVLAGCAAELAAKGGMSSNGTGQPYLNSHSCHPEQSEGSRQRQYMANEIPRKARNDKTENMKMPPSEHLGPDLLAGQADKFNLPNMLSPAGLKIEREKRNIPPLPPPPLLPAFSTKRAIVKVQDGCDGRCAYCIVPQVRGASRSRPADEIVAEITKLTLGGFTEIVLTGANLGCYADGGIRLPQLLEKVEAVAGLPRFRISSLEIANASSSFPTRSGLPELGQGIQEIPKQNRDWIPASAGMTDTIHAIIDFMAASKKICFSLHLPLQSGSDRILKAMGRPYTAEEYCALIEYAQKKLGIFGLGTDIIVGFPGETEADFKATEQIVKQLLFSKLHVFSYSPRPGTTAFAMPESVSKKEKERRAAALIELGRRKRNEFAKQFVGKKLTLLVEKIKPDGWAEGWTGEYLWACVKSTNPRLKQIVPFICERADDDVLLGKL